MRKLISGSINFYVFRPGDKLIGKFLGKKEIQLKGRTVPVLLIQEEETKIPYYVVETSRLKPIENLPLTTTVEIFYKGKIETEAGLSIHDFFVYQLD